MKQIGTPLVLFLLAASMSLPAQTSSTSASQTSTPSATSDSYNHTATATKSKKSKKGINPAPFSRLALSGGISLMGVNMQAATNVDRYVNLRVTGNYFSYSMNNESINDYMVTGSLKFAALGASADVYPFPRHGLRFSPGVLLYNQNGASADVTVAGGSKLSLNNMDYYSSSTNPITGNAILKLNKRNPAFTATTGWGNLISRRGGHWSFPFELGAAFVDKPTLNMVLTKGTACDASGVNCVDVSDSTLQSNLQTQVKKYENDVDILRFYPIISFGVGYNFRIR